MGQPADAPGRKLTPTHRASAAAEEWALKRKAAEEGELTEHHTFQPVRRQKSATTSDGAGPAVRPRPRPKARGTPGITAVGPLESAVAARLRGRADDSRAGPLEERRV